MSRYDDMTLVAPNNTPDVVFYAHDQAEQRRRALYFVKQFKNATKASGGP